MELPDGAWDRRKELTSGEYELYQALCKFRCRDKDSENYGLAFPNRETLSGELSMVKEYVSQITSSLIRKGWIEKIGWKIRLLVGFEKLDNSYKLESKKVRIKPPKSKNSPPQKLESKNAHIRNIEPLEPIEPVPEARAREDDPLPFEPGQPQGREFGTVIKWIEQNAAMEIPTAGSFAHNLMRARDRDCERPIDPDTYRLWILNCFEDVGPPGQFQDFDIWRREINTCLKNSRVAGRYCSPKKQGNGVNGNGQNGTTQSKFAADSQERAESFVRSVSYFDRRVEAAYRAADSTEALVKRATDPAGPD